MKESQSHLPVNFPDNNNIINNPKERKEYSTHSIKMSSLPLDMEQKQDDAENINGTVSTLLGPLQKGVEEKKDAISNLTKSTEKTEETSNNSLEGSNKDEKAETESFYQKTKRWAGTVWNYVNIKNYFPKTEYIEYRNCNGDIVKIPKKKLPLKNKRVEQTKEQYIVNKTVDRDNQKILINAADNFPLASHFI